jgi:hypothetical protein
MPDSENKRTFFGRLMDGVATVGAGLSPEAAVLHDNTEVDEFKEPKPMQMIIRRNLELQAQVERLELILEATIRTLEEHHELNIEHLREQIKVTDMLDGKLDGRIGPQVRRRL